MDGGGIGVEGGIRGWSKWVSNVRSIAWQVLTDFFQYFHDVMYIMSCTSLVHQYIRYVTVIVMISKDIFIHISYPMIPYVLRIEHRGLLHNLESAISPQLNFI